MGRKRENRRWDARSVDTNDETKLVVIKRGKGKRGAGCSKPSKV